MKLRHDPFRIFRSSKTPEGLYARQKWLQEYDTPQWQKDFQETVNALLDEQLPDGSWHRSPLNTIARLFGLHLTVRSSFWQVENALTWLLGKIDLEQQEIRVHWDGPISRSDLKALPFTPSRSDMFFTAATLFLCTIFGRQDDPSVLALYRWLCKKEVEHEGFWSDVTAFHNIFRALVVHPLFAKDATTTLMVEHLSDKQTVDGGWGADLPFYQTLNALAHLKLPQGERQLERAFTRLVETQNSDGTWGRHGVEWNTFLSVHALRNKGIL